MHIIHLRSLFKYLLSGSILLLLATVEAAPKPNTTHLVQTAELLKRAGVTHPSATHPMTLFHGTDTSAAAASMAQHVDLSKTHTCGDLHHNAKHGSDGGAYFTDSLIAAAQFSCYKDAYDPHMKLPTTVYVLEFFWSPAGHSVFEFTEKDKYTLSEAQCSTHDMISGPMWNPITDKDFTTDFWQYAIVRQAAIPGLSYEHTYIAHCKNVPKGNALTGGMYESGQGGNSGFLSLANHLAS